MTYPKFGSIPRWYKDFTISEKIDGSNGLIAVFEEGIEYDLLRTDGIEPVAFHESYAIFAGSRNRWLSAEKTKDNAGFAQWVREHSADASLLGPGLHYGEWYGRGIQRGYGLDHKRFALFNTHRWGTSRPDNFDVVPVLWQGSGDDIQSGIDEAITQLFLKGSALVEGYRNPEGLVIYSHENRVYWKKTLDNDRSPKSVG